MCEKLSVVVPVYNSEKYLHQCIDSILQQTYKNIEVILVDDGSEDASGRICDDYAVKDSRVLVIHKKNEGLIKARLSGTEKASGSCITFVDGDDWIEPHTYEQMMECMGDSDIIIAGIYRYYSDAKIKEDLPMLKEGYYHRNAIEKDIIPYMLWSNKRNTWELDPSLCTKIFKKNLFISYMRNAGNLDIYFGEDTAVIFPFILNATSAVVMHKCYYYHRQRQNGAVSSYFLEDTSSDKLFFLYKYLKENFENSPYWNILHRQLEHFYMNAIQLKQQGFSDYKEIEEDIFPFWKIKKGDNVVLYGAGETGHKFYMQNEQYHFCNIVLWADKNYKKLNLKDKRIASPDQIAGQTFDYIVIAVRSAGIVQEIVKMFTEMGISLNKIVWNGVLIREIYF